MNRTMTITVFSLMAFSFSLKAQNDENECALMLKDGLYAFTKMTNTGSLDQDFWTYLLSETFREELKSGKWGASIGIPLVDVLLSLGASHSESQYQQFRSKLVQQSSFRLSQQNSQVLLSSIPNVNLAAEYTNCIEKNRKFGFKVTSTYGEDYANFIITYVPQVSTDPMPKVQFFDIENGESIKNAFTKDQVVQNMNSVSTKRNPDKDLILTLQTDRGAVTYKVAAESPLSTSKELPIGTIVCSFLTFEQFNLASKNNEKSPGSIFTTQKSRWAPCDGRPAPGSNFQRVTSQNNVPDLRGMFMRGLNMLDPNQPVLPVVNGDPENRVAGHQQGDAIKEHSHNLEGSSFTYVNQHPSDRAQGGGGNTSRPLSFPNNNHTIKVKKDGEGLNPNETRPKNVAVYYYIKIN
ncbi:MAG TPA: hypothetical protein VMR70_05475 [Flavisolibacter sp.]|nr:hypothetical protein [Flavisolibacter sp.]